MNKSTISILLAVAALTIVVYIMATKSQKELTDNLPPKDDTSKTEAEALTKAGEYAAKINASVAGVLGTGSMAPYIPPAAEGLDPYFTRVAYVVYDPRSKYKDVKVGNLCQYFYRGDHTKRFLHQAAAKDDAGWLMTGLHNKSYEKDSRMTEDNFLGVVIKTYTWDGK